MVLFCLFPKHPKIEKLVQEASKWQKQDPNLGQQAQYPCFKPAFHTGPAITPYLVHGFTEYLFFFGSSFTEYNLHTAQLTHLKSTVHRL